MSASTDDETTSSNVSEDVAVSRRGWGKHMLLSASALAVLFATNTEQAQAAPTDPWMLGGNSTTSADFLGTTNSAPLIFKTAGIERMRISATGNIGISNTSPSLARMVVDVTSGVGVYARHIAMSGDAAAVRGDTSANVAGAMGVQGVIVSTAPGTDSAGVRGINNGTTENGAGVRGSHAGGGIGVHGSAPNTNQGIGVRGDGSLAGVYGEGGAYGLSASGTIAGVVAASPDTGVYGSGVKYGIWGTTDSGVGVFGVTKSGTGVLGESKSNGNTINAIYGHGLGQGNTGVQGAADNGTSAYGVWGRSSSGYAGYFDGKVTVTGTLVKGAGSFKIDHPLDPDNKYLSHSFVESPDMMNIYNGNVVLDAKGEATVTMPEWFEALNMEFRYQLTCIGGFAPIYIATKIAGNRFRIAGGTGGMEVSWQVTGVRQDAFAKANRIPVEEEKLKAERGKYLHPKAFGKPQSADIQAVRIAAVNANTSVRQVLQPNMVPPNVSN